MKETRLFIFEFANNHMGDIDHALKMVESYAATIKNFRKATSNTNFEFAIKFQFRDIDTFIHPDFKNRMDLKYVKRFSETKIEKEDFKLIKETAEKAGFKTICTGFDENSVFAIEKMNFDYIKVASCSCTDWPLLSAIAKVNMPIIVSTAGTMIEDVDRVVSFFKNRKKDLTIMHCVGQYPTSEYDLQLNQISFLMERYPTLRVGFSTHEEPDNYESVKIALGKGATVFEKHVAVVTEKYSKNAYSSTPDQVEKWLLAADYADRVCGDSNVRYTPSVKEKSDLKQFKRAVFAKRNISKGEVINDDNVFYAWPPSGGQVLANDMSMFTQYVAEKDFVTNEAIHNNSVTKFDSRSQILKIVEDVKSLLKDANIVYPGQAKLEISHHYGIDKFYETGITMITVVNREYCKKLIIVLPGQQHPEQFHKQKEETFVVLHGDLELTLDDKKNELLKGDVVTVEPLVRHRFTTKNGCVVEEISSTHYTDDSFYTDKNITNNKNRKTFITHWLD